MMGCLEEGNMRRRLAGVVLVAWMMTGGALAETHPLGFDDLIGMERVSGPVPSPDGRWLVFAQRTYSL